jgi:hypothetical protein
LPVYPRCVNFVGRHGQTKRRSGSGDLLVVAFAISVRYADETERFDAGFRDVLEDGRCHQIVVRDHLERPFTAVIHRLDDRRGRGQRNNRSFGLQGNVEHRQGDGGQRRANQDVHTVLDHQAAGVLGALAGIRLIVERDVDNLLAAYFLGQRGNRPHLGLAERRSRTGRGHDDSHLDVRVRM